MASLPLLTRLTAIVMSALLLACSSQSGIKQELPGIPQDLVFCPEIRPQMCTMQYDPVCAWHADGRSSTKGSACSACGDSGVKGYLPGECPASE